MKPSRGKHPNSLKNLRDWDNCRINNRISVKCIVCGKQFKLCKSRIELIKCCSLECRKIRLQQNGSINGKKNYITGIFGYRKLAKDNLPQYCFMCGKENCYLLVHHLDGNRNNNKLENLVICCKSCHTKIHRRKKW